MAYVYLVLTSQFPEHEYELVTAPDIATASERGIVLLLKGEAPDRDAGEGLLRGDGGADFLA